MRMESCWQPYLALPFYLLHRNIHRRVASVLTILSPPNQAQGRVIADVLVLALADIKILDINPSIYALQEES